MCDKKCFTKIEAQSALNHNKHSGKQYRKEQRMYYCEDCNAWHLTSREDLRDTVSVEIWEDKWEKFLNNE